MTAVRPLVAGNWKMNGTAVDLGEVSKLLAILATGAKANCDILLCPPATLVARMASTASGSAISVGGQDCHAKASGAHTGDVSAEMLREAGARYVIVGHSERRADHAETDAVVKAKAEAAHRAGLIVIVCVGETNDQRKAGTTLDVVLGQVRGSLPAASTAANTVLAYEPVWAIGTGLTPTAADVAEVHAAVRNDLQSLKSVEGVAMRLLYGGSVKPGNARELMGVPHVNGALVGGASLKAADFAGIIAAYR